jgi:cytochrome c-type biogenesis protein
VISIVRRTLILTGLAAVALAVVALTGFWHPNAPTAALQSYLPVITLPTVITAAVIDGINPCAFTVLLLFITTMLATAQTGQMQESAIRMRLVRLGAIFIGAIFFTYLALGVGLLQSVKLLTNQHLPARLGAMFAVFLGLWMIKDFFLPGWGWQLHGPAWMVAVTRRTAQRATVPALVGGGILIGLCTVPCSGAVYLGIISLLALQPSALLGYAYLVLYNVIFILPLIVILVAASARPTLNHLAHWNLHHKEWVRLILGSGVVVMGLLILAAV